MTKKTTVVILSRDRITTVVILSRWFCHVHWYSLFHSKPWTIALSYLLTSFTYSLYTFMLGSGDVLVLHPYQEPTQWRGKTA